MTTERLTVAQLKEVIASINRDARLIVHPDDEDVVRDALAKLPEDVRPTLVVSPAVKESGTAYYSRAVPLDKLTLPPGSITNVHKPDLDELVADEERRLHDYLKAKAAETEARAEGQQDLHDTIHGQRAAQADALADREPLYLPSGELVAGERAARYRRLRRRIAQRVDDEVYGEHPPIDPIDFLGGLNDQ